ncbi:hypothetical protein K469DRAFT_687442 [Zopfia rhizophila CBS 207.26]|uniref:Xylanolytic transcriptional activator regulatory domain-containing protein n=1 Tax=Zopfia rhizophila CBS 207.26 TaxID=1314779 RepID=A0A6A6E845_9PEZI|nr:hypothetical protein K469DRAFT_687442 [Zopfia rhizophila CBS 207.26]
MSATTSSPNKRCSRTDDDIETSGTGGEPAARKRRVLMQTMGRQLREFGTEGLSPRDHTRGSFGTSPASHFNPLSSHAIGAKEDQGSQGQIQTPESDTIPGEDDQLPSGATKSASKWLWRAGEVLATSPTETNHSHSFQHLLDWSQSYFDHWHPAFPFVHAPSLLEYFHQRSQRGELSDVNDSEEFLHTILRSVLSISLIDRRQVGSSMPRVPSSLVFHSFNDAMNSIQRVLIEESSIQSLQAVVSVQLFLISMQRYNAASRLEGLCVRMAFQLGLHRCPAKLTALPAKEVELRKRLFWSIYCIDRYICIRLGIPLGIRTEDIDVCYPHAEKHGNVDHEPLMRDDRLDLLEFLAQHATIRGSIMELRNRSATYGGEYFENDQAMNIDAELTKWWNNVDEYLSSCDQGFTVTKLHQVTLIVLRFESTIALYRSVVATSNKNSSYNAALQRCISASRSVINTLHKALKGFGAFDGSPGQSGYETTPLLWPSFTWAVWMSAFIIVFAASEDQVPRDVVCRLTDRSLEVLKHLSLRGTNWPDACAIAIQNLVGRLNEQGNRSTTSTRSSTADFPQQNTRRTPSAIHRGSQTAPPTSSASRAGVRPFPTRPDFHDMQQRHVSGFNIGQHQNHQPPTAPPPSGMLPLPDSPQTQGQFLRPGAPTNSNPYPFSESTIQNTVFPDISNFASSWLAGTGTFLGIGQQLSDNPIPNDEIMQLFNGEDTGLWFGNGGDFGFSGGA